MNDRGPGSFTRKMNFALVLLVICFFSEATLAQEAPAVSLTQISSDPYTAATAPTGEHATEVEPDTFAWGSTVVSAFHTGRVFNLSQRPVGCL